MSAEVPMDDIRLPPTPGPSTTAIMVSGMLAALLWLVVAFLVLIMVPRFTKLFADFKMKVPILSERVLLDSWWIAPACLFVALLVCLPRPTRSIGLMLLIVAPLVLSLVIAAGLYLPYAELLDGIGGGKK